MERTQVAVEAFLRAAKVGKVDQLRKTLEEDATIVEGTDGSGRNAAHFSCHEGHLEVTKLLVEAKCDITKADFDGLTPFMMAAKQGHKDLVRTFITAENVNAQSDKGTTALHHAAQSGHLDMMQLLFTHGARCPLEPTESGSPLHWASYGGSIDPVAYVMDTWNVPVDTVDANNGTVLHQAVGSGHADLVLFLLERQANPKAQARGGTTPLHIAVAVGATLDLVKALMEFGAENTPEEDGETPLAAAEAKGDTVTRDLVRELQKLASGGYALTPEKRQENMDRFKAQGNKVFQAGEYSKSARFYTKAISYQPGNHVLFSNRSAAQFNLQRYHRALADANQCVRLNPAWPKGYFRKGATLARMGDAEGARATFEEGLKLDPKNADIKGGLKELAEKEGGGAAAKGGAAGKGGGGKGKKK